MPGATDSAIVAPSTSWKQDDRPSRPGEDALRIHVQLHQLAGGRQVARHHRERLLLALLAAAQRRDGLLVAGHGGQVIAAETLHRDDPPGAQQLGGDLDRLTGERLAPPCHQAQPRTAGRARDRLRVEATVRRILVLARAVLTHGEAGHRGTRPVVRHVSHDREARAAVRAIGERIAEASIVRVEQLAQAVLARGDVGRHQDLARAVRRAVQDRELALSEGAQADVHELLDHRQRRRLAHQHVDEARDRPAVALDLDHRAARVVGDVAREAQARREGVSEGAEPDALHQPVDVDAPALARAGVPPRASGPRPERTHQADPPRGSRTCRSPW